MSKYLRLLFLVMFFASPLLAQRGIRAIPAEAQTDRYPFHSAVTMTAAEMAKLKLHPVALVEATQVLNYYRNVDRFVLETLRVGTVVLADSVGTPWYKVDCVNRLISPKICPSCRGLLGGVAGTIDSAAVRKAHNDSIARFAGLFGSTKDSAASAKKTPGFWDSVSDNFDSLMDGTKSLLSWVLPLLIWLLLLGLLAAGLWWLYTQLRESGSGGGVPPRPIVTPPTPVVGPTPPAPTPTPVPLVVSPVSPLTPISTPPAPVPVTRTFVHFAPADGRDANMLRYSDNVRSITHESENGVNTIRFRI